ncbi:hypothetical protein [Polaribacter sp. 11A2H]|uniref:hypothetical protein n=1 Tax=Polaribacter sp. 11A2H TaxID=2687290 RepID=UPI00140B95DE|nr:hypothetical protein [Polaribacter sp. 11A2H]
MIQYVKRKDLNILKYDACIENSIQSRIYAFSWYLDIVADNWDVLVLGDYKAVMPLPWKQKYFIKYITQPFFCQQLGVFALENITEDLFSDFLKALPKTFVKINLQFNSDNYLIEKMNCRINYTLGLNNNYDTIFKSFSKRRKRSVKAGVKNNLFIKSSSISDLIKIKKEFYKHISFPENLIEKLADYIINNDKGFILGVFKDDVLLGGSLFLKSNNRIIYLFSAYNNEARKLNASSFLINNVIKEYQNSNFILDFEGSNLPDIGSFFKSFGAENERYYYLNSNALNMFF